MITSENYKNLRIIIFDFQFKKSGLFIIKSWTINKLGLTTPFFFIFQKKVIMNDNELLSKLTQNLLEILHDEEYDITIEVGNDPYIKIFRAHMNILYYRSPYLRRILSVNKKKNDDTLAHIELPNILPETFHVILRFVFKSFM